MCLSDKPDALRFFDALEDAEKHRYIRSIYAAKTDDIKVERIVHSINRLSRRMLFSSQK